MVLALTFSEDTIVLEIIDSFGSLISKVYFCYLEWDIIPTSLIRCRFSHRISEINNQGRG